MFFEKKEKLSFRVKKTNEFHDKRDKKDKKR